MNGFMNDVYRCEKSFSLTEVKLISHVKCDRKVIAKLKLALWFKDTVVPPSWNIPPSWNPLQSSVLGVL